MAMTQPKECWLPLNPRALRDEDLQRRVFGYRWQFLHDTNRAALYSASDAYKLALRLTSQESLVIRNGEVRFFLANDMIWADQRPCSNVVPQRQIRTTASNNLTYMQPAPSALAAQYHGQSVGSTGFQGRMTGNLNPAVSEFVPLRQPERSQQSQSTRRQDVQQPSASDEDAVDDYTQASLDLAFEADIGTCSNGNAISQAAASHGDGSRVVVAYQPPRSGRSNVGEGHAPGRQTGLTPVTAASLACGQPPRRDFVDTVLRWRQGTIPRRRGTELTSHTGLGSGYDPSRPTIWSSHTDFASQVWSIPSTSTRPTHGWSIPSVSTRPTTSTRASVGSPLLEIIGRTLLDCSHA